MERKCELCSARAALYCEADEAFVCWECDSNVHGANFIVARHMRSVLCHRCSTPTTWCASGACFLRTTCLCAACQPANLRSDTKTETGNSNLTANAVTMSNQSLIVADTASPSPAMEILWKSLRPLPCNKLGESVSADIRCFPDCRPRSPVSVISSGREFAKKRRILVLEKDSVESCNSDSDSEDSEELTDSLDSEDQRQSLESPFCRPNSLMPSRSSMCRRRPLQTQNRSTEQDQGASNNDQFTFLDLRRLGRAAEATIERVIREWHDHLNLRSPSVIALAMHLLRRLLATIKVADMDSLDARFFIAGCLWISIKVLLPRAARSRSWLYEQCTGVPLRVLLAAEAHIYRLLNWRVDPETLLRECESGL